MPQPEAQLASLLDKVWGGEWAHQSINKEITREKSGLCIRVVVSRWAKSLLEC